MKIFSLSLISSLLLVNSAYSAQLSNDLLNSSLIVYNGSIALVHEERDLHVNQKDTTIVYEGVAKTIETDSVNVRFDDAITLYSQQFRFDKLTRTKLLEAHIAKEVSVRIATDRNNFKIITAELLSNDADYCIVKTSQNEIFTVLSNDIIFKTIPDELITKPSLVWNITANKTIKSTMELDYLINNIDWKSDYILNLTGNRADLSGWITINNRSGKRFNSTNLHVLAGDINRASRPNTHYRASKAMVMAEASSAVTHQAHEGYHFYSIPFKVTLANNEKTQIKFIDEKNIHVNRRYNARLSHPSYLHGEVKHDVTQYLHFKGLDFPLPKGVVRTYSKLQDKTILLGETSLKHTPKNTPIDLKLGNNFDLKVTETIVGRNDDKRYYGATVQYTIKNSSNETKNVELLVPFNKHVNNTIDTSKKYQFKKGNLVAFNIEVKGESFEKFEVSFRSKKQSN